MDSEKYTKEELIKQVEELKKQLSEANAANVAKETFLSNMSHDIRTPMNAIVGMTALAKNHIDEKPRVIDALNKIETASSHLLSLINDVLDMSRINSGKMSISSERFSLPELIHDTSIIIKPMMESRGHEWVLSVDDIENESFYGDTLRLRQVLVNIISNAAKYTPDNGHIEFSVFECADGGPGSICFECKDSGIGMSREFVERIFEPFERVSNSTISKVEGTGLGMSIVKKIVDAMNGTIKIESEEGKGTDVRIKLPLEPAEDPENATALKGRRALVIESGAKLSERYSAILPQAGMESVIVPSASAAISAITDAGFAGKSFDLAVIGEELQESRNIFEIASYLSKSCPGIAVVLVGSDNWEEIAYQAEKSGIKSFIPVPFFRKSLINGLAAALSDGGSGIGTSGLPDLGGKNILLVEDNFINMEIAKEILSATNANIDTAENGKEAVERFESSPLGYYSVILMDIQMPVMNGYEAAEAIRKSGRPDSDVTIFAMTANTFAEDIAKARACGMNGHIAKPIDMNVLMQTLRQAVV